ncbi:MAG: hypothetical protein RL745_323, partial [Actinomycetota bacterium]
MSRQSCLPSSLRSASAARDRAAAVTPPLSIGVVTAYLDHAATTALSASAQAAMSAAALTLGNPSSLHAAGRAARSLVEDARERIAGAFDAAPGDVVFTAGATEADNLAIIGLHRAQRAVDPRRRLVIASPTEHHAVLEAIDYLIAHEGAHVHWLAVDSDGVVDLDDLRAVLAAGDAEVLPALVAVMAANNETGTRQPLSAISRLCAEAAVPWHCDAVQAAAWVRVSFAQLGCATMAISAHKLGGPVGIGALFIAAGVDIAPINFGGGQERKLRSGTVNTAAVSGFAAAVDERVSWIDAGGADQVAHLRDALIAGIVEADPQAVVNGGGTVLPSIANITFPGCEADALLMLLDAAGVHCSLGAACTAGVPEPSHVLLAMGAGAAAARASLRFSLGMGSTAADVATVVAALP